MARRSKQLADRAFPVLAHQGCCRKESLELALPEEHTHPEGIDRSRTPASKAQSTAFALDTLQHLVPHMRQLQATRAVPTPPDPDCPNLGPAPWG